MGSNERLPSLIAVPDALWRDVRRTLAIVFSRPTRLRRLAALGPRGLADTARFLVTVIPRAGRELATIRRRAVQIPDDALRAQALASIDGKAYHVQGGAILGTFLHGATMRRYVEIVAALETIYDYLDNLCDRLPGVTPVAYATLHEALLDALDDRRTPADYYADGPLRDDGGYLRWLVERARAGLAALPNYAAVRDRLLEVGGFYAQLQTFKHGDERARERVCSAWYDANAARFPGLAWWEFAAACGSSLPVFALVELAARPQLDPAEIAPTLHAYFPGVSAVHILLDYFIDQAEDAEHRELNFVACYASPAIAAARVRDLVTVAAERVRDLAGAARHRFVLEAMCVFYLTHPKVFEQRLEAESAVVLTALG